MFVQGELAALIALLPGLAPYLEDARISDEILDLGVGPQEVLSSVGWTGEELNLKWMILQEFSRQCLMEQFLINPQLTYSPNKQSEHHMLWHPIK